MTLSALEPLEWDRVAPYLDQALDLEPGERAGWLTQLAATQPDIAKLVRELLAQLDTANEMHFLEGSALELINLSSIEPISMAGQRVGAYTIDRILGHGGMGEVWLASRHDGHFEGRCAIKLLDRLLTQPNRAERFRGEGRMLARLTHPNIARLIDAGTAPDGRHYLAIEYVDGERIDHYCEARMLDVNARVRLFLEVVSAVAHAHANLIIHRDLKPSNVLVTREGTVKLLDFGIAKLLSNDPSYGDPVVTRYEEVALTPEYAAPEQLLCEMPSTATDVYQLGMLLYVLLTGQHPIPPSGTRAERIKTALDGQMPRASDLAARDIAGLLRGDLDAILAMSLRKEPRERYATALALGEDLLRFLNREPVSARRGAALYGVRKFIARHRLAVVAVSLAIAGLCGALVFAIEQVHESSRQRDRARLEAKRAQAQGMTLMISAIGAPGDPISPEEMLDNGVRLLEAQYADDPAFEVRELIHISGRYTEWGNHQREYGVLAMAEAIARRSPNPRELARVQCNSVETEIALGHIDRAAVRLAEGRAALAKAQDTELVDTVDCLGAAAHLSVAQGRGADAIADLERGVAMLERPGVGPSFRHARMLDYLGEIYATRGDFNRSYLYLRRSRLSKERGGYSGTAGWNATARKEVSTLLVLSRSTIGDHDERAEAFARAALLLDEAMANDPDSSADVGEASLVLAQARFARHDVAGTYVAAHRANEVLTRAMGAEHRLTTAAAALEVRAHALLNADDHPAAQVNSSGE